MQTFKHKLFSQWAKDESFTDATLKTAVDELAKGLFEANLGGGLYKKRVPRSGQGKRGAYRTLVAFKQNHRSVFAFGFAKSERVNISATEKEIYKRLANHYLNATEDGIKQLLKIGE